MILAFKTFTKDQILWKKKKEGEEAGLGTGEQPNCLCKPYHRLKQPSRQALEQIMLSSLELNSPPLYSH